MHDTFTAFQAAKMEAYIDKVKPPYLYDYYNIQYGFHPPLSQVRNAQARYYNALIELMNGKEMKLPKYIIMIVEKDLIEDVMKMISDYGFKKLFRVALDWVMSEIGKALATRKEDLRSKCGGALSTSAEPRIIWVSTIRHPYNIMEEVKPIYKLVRKANEVLEDLVRKYDKYSHMMYIDSLDEHKFFDVMGKLTVSGKSAYWRAIDGLMRKFDRSEIDLNVRSPGVQVVQQNQDYKSRQSRPRHRCRNHGRRSSSNRGSRTSNHRRS